MSEESMASSNQVIPPTIAAMARGNQIWNRLACKLRSWAVRKTGTSQDYRDAWLVGFERQSLVTTIWIGNDDNSPCNDMPRDKTGGNKS